jgi:hypothetical protein
MQEQLRTLENEKQELQMKTQVQQSALSMRELEGDSVSQSRVLADRETVNLRLQNQALLDSLERAQQLIRKGTEALAASETDRLRLEKDLRMKAFSTSGTDGKISKPVRLEAEYVDLSQRYRSIAHKLGKLQKKYESAKDSYWNLELQSCSKEEYERCLIELDEKDNKLRELRGLVAQQRSDLENQQSLIEELREKYLQTDESHDRAVKQLNVLTASSRELHGFVMGLIGDSLSCGSITLQVIEHLKPLFVACSLPVFGLSLVCEPVRALMSFRVFSVRANPEHEIFKPQHRDLLTEITGELLGFPMSRSGASLITPTETIAGKLKNILSLIKSLRSLYRENEESVGQLSALVKSQHTAIVQMTQTPA